MNTKVLGTPTTATQFPTTLKPKNSAEEKTVSKSLKATIIIQIIITSQWILSPDESKLKWF